MTNSIEYSKINNPKAMYISDLMLVYVVRNNIGRRMVPTAKL